MLIKMPERQLRGGAIPLKTNAGASGTMRAGNLNSPGYDRVIFRNTLAGGLAHAKAAAYSWPARRIAARRDKEINDRGDYPLPRT
jgi:hypothetical protein